MRLPDSNKFIGAKIQLNEDSNEDNVDFKKLRNDMQQKWRAYLKDNKTVDNDRYTGLDGK